TEVAATIIRLGPPVTRRFMRPTRGLGDAPAAAANRGIALLFGLAPGRARLVSPRPKPGSSLWRWSSPRGGRALPATLRRGARTFLTGARLAPRPRAIVWLTRQPRLILLPPHDEPASLAGRFSSFASGAGRFSSF